MFVCLSVPKDLANRWTYIVLLYRVASHRSWEGLLLFWGRVLQPSQEKSPLEKLLTPQNIFLLFLFKSKIKIGLSNSTPPSRVPLETSRGVATSVL